MSLFINLKKLGVNTTVLAASISLVACGGGGSDGYYDKGVSEGGNGGADSPGNENESQTDAANIISTLTMAVQDADGKAISEVKDGSKVRVAVKVLNADKGGIADQAVRLNITDTNNIGVTSSSAKVSSGEDGYAFFELDIPSLKANTGSVQLTAFIDGTSVKQVYTLNIKKTSVIVSEYKLSIPQGITLNLPKGSNEVVVHVTDAKGGVKSGQTVELSLPESMQGKFVTSTGSVLKTNDQGQAVFKITANSNLNTTEISTLVNSSHKLSFKLVDEHKAEKTGVATITFKDVSGVIDKLEIIKPDNALPAQNGVAKIRVYARNSDGKALANKAVNLSTNRDSYGVTLDKAQGMTNEQGYAEFILKANSEQPNSLSQQDIELTATYVEGNEKISAKTTVDVITADISSEDKEQIQRLEIASSYQINAINGNIEIKVKAINYNGVGAKEGKIKIELNKEATSNGVSFEGSHEKNVDANGFVTFKLKTSSNQTTAAIEALKSSGVEATFTTSNGVSSIIKISVNEVEVSEEDVKYLSFEPITERFDYTQAQKITIKVRAIGDNDGAIKNKKISLTRIGLTTTQLQALHLDPLGTSQKVTDENGVATFEFQYTPSQTGEQKTLALNGVKLQAISENGKAQEITLRFKEPSATSEVTLEALNIDTIGLASLEINKTTTIDVIVNANGTDGKQYANQLIGLGLNEVAVQSGAIIKNGAAKTSGANGQAVFQIEITPKNNAELQNLINSGLTLAVKANNSDISNTRKILLSTPVVKLQDLTELRIEPTTAISVLGGETRVKFKALDNSGKPIANTPITIALSSLTSGRVSLNDIPVKTNSDGDAEFTVALAEGAYEKEIIQRGITFAIVGTNLNTGDRIQQTHNIAVNVPANALNPRLTADASTVQAGQTVKIYAAVKDETGFNTAGTPMRLSLDAVSQRLGVKLSHESVLASQQGAVVVDLIIPQGLTRSQLTSINVTGAINNANGSTIRTTLAFSVEDIVNPYHLTIDSSRVSLSSAGDSAFVTVKLLDKNQGGVANEKVSLAIADPRNATSIKGASQLITNQFGEAVFEVSMKSLQGTLVLPVLPIELTATHTTATGAPVSLPGSIQVHSPTVLAPELDLKIKVSKDKLNVRGDSVEVSVLVVDLDGSSQAGKAVTLTIPQYNQNGAYIHGASTIESDENGWAKFSIVIDESLRNPSYDFVAADLRVEAVVKDTQNTERRVPHVIDVVNSEVPVTIGSIAVNFNPTELTSTGNGIYYQKEGSVQLVDVDGKPVANQDVVLDIRPTSYVLGEWKFEIQKDPWKIVEQPGVDVDGNPITLKVKELDAIYPFTNLKGWIKPSDYYYPLVGAIPAQVQDKNSATTCTVDPTTTTWMANGQALRVVRFLGGANNNSITHPYTTTYRTDSTGRFDFVIEYPKANAHWVAVEVGAKTTLAQTPTRGYTTLTLPSLSTDYAADGSYAPNRVSPYTTCSN